MHHHLQAALTASLTPSSQAQAACEAQRAAVSAAVCMGVYDKVSGVQAGEAHPQPQLPAQLLKAARHLQAKPQDSRRTHLFSTYGVATAQGALHAATSSAEDQAGSSVSLSLGVSVAHSACQQHRSGALNGLQEVALGLLTMSMSAASFRPLGKLAR